MEKDRPKALAELLVVRFEQLERQHPGQFVDALEWACKAAALLAAEGRPPPDELRALLADGRRLPQPDCALQEGLYVLDALLRASARHS